MSCIGVNPSSITDFYGDLTFADANKHRRPYYVHSTGSPCGVDSLGWPTADFDVIFAGTPTGLPRQAPSLVNGRYAVRFTGKAGAAGANLTPCTIVSNLYNTATNTTDLVVDLQTDPNNNLIGLQFFNTQRTAASATGTGITNLQIMRPIAAGSTTPHNFGELFSRQFLAALAPFGAIRTLDLNATNVASPADSITWAARRLPTDANQSSYGTNRGIAYEYQVMMANAIGGDLWVPLSIYLNDDHATKFFQLCCYGSDGLNPYTSLQKYPVYPPLAGKLLFTFGNENWNYSGDIAVNAAANRDAASAEYNAGDTTYSSEAYTRAQQRAAKNTARLSNLARAVYGDSGFGTRFFPIYESQQETQDGTTFGQLKIGLDYIKNNNTSPVNQIIWGAGCSWYHYPPALWSVLKTGGTTYPTAAQMFAVPPATTFPAMTAGFQFVHGQYGLNFVCYEGGEVFEIDADAGNVAAIDPVQTDSRFGPYVSGTINLAVASGASYLMVYGLGQTPWQLTRSTNDLTPIKYTATVAAITANAGFTPPMGYPNFAPISQTINARAIDANTTILSTGYLNFPAATLIEVAFAATQAAAGPGIAVLIDNASVQTAVFPITGSFPAPVGYSSFGGGYVRMRVVVPAGAHTLDVKALQALATNIVNLTINPVTTREVDNLKFDLSTALAGAANGADLATLIPGATHAGGDYMVVDKANNRLIPTGGATGYYLGITGDYAIEASTPALNGQTQGIRMTSVVSSGGSLVAGIDNNQAEFSIPNTSINAADPVSGAMTNPVVQIRHVGGVSTLLLNGYEVIRGQPGGTDTLGQHGIGMTVASLTSLKIWSITTVPATTTSPSTTPTTVALTLPTTATVGTAATATLTLTGGTAPATADTVVTLVYSGATGPATVTIPAGSLTATFNITPTATSYTITATATGLIGSGAVAGTATSSSGSGSGSGTTTGTTPGSALTADQAAAIAQIPTLVTMVQALSTAVAALPTVQSVAPVAQIPGLVTQVQALSTAVAALPSAQGIATVVLAGLPTATIGHLADKAGFALAASGLDAIAVETGINARQALSPILAASAGVVAGAGTGVVIIKGGSTSTTRITATTDNAGNRSSVTLNLPA